MVSLVFHYVVWYWSDCGLRQIVKIRKVLENRGHEKIDVDTHLDWWKRPSATSPDTQTKTLKILCLHLMNSASAAHNVYSTFSKFTKVMIFAVFSFFQSGLFAAISWETRKHNKKVIKKSSIYDSRLAVSVPMTFKLHQFQLLVFFFSFYCIFPV